MKKAKKRVLYDNHNLYRDFLALAEDRCMRNGVYNPTKRDILLEIVFHNNIFWNELKESLQTFFSKSLWILYGTIERKGHSIQTGYVFNDFKKVLKLAVKGCKYVCIYDVNGHLFLESTCDDSVNRFEIRRVTDKGIIYLNNWRLGKGNHRDLARVYQQIMKKYSVLPHFAHITYGYLKTEYECDAQA